MTWYEQDDGEPDDDVIARTNESHAATTDRVTVREAFDLRYHVPRSQVWEGSRGGQRGNVHLHVKAGEAFQAGRIRRVQFQSLCGRKPWYPRSLEGNEGKSPDDWCDRCLEIGTRSNGVLSELVTA